REGLHHARTARASAAGGRVRAQLHDLRPTGDDGPGAAGTHRARCCAGAYPAGKIRAGVGDRMRHFLANVVAYTLAVSLFIGAALFARMRQSQYTLTYQATVLA